MQLHQAHHSRAKRAIRESVYKSFQITAEHFGAHYDNAPCRYFIYNSAKLSDVRQFATSSNIEIMVINIDAFKKSENIINQEQDKLNGETAMRYIQDTRPIVIIDEPQSVENTNKKRDADNWINPWAISGIVKDGSADFLSAVVWLIKFPKFENF